MSYRSDPQPERTALARQVQPYLGANEKLVWVARPKQGVLVRPTDAFTIPITVIWTGGVCFGVVMAVVVVKSTLLALFMLPLLVAGAYGAVGRFFWDAHRRRYAIYALTERRLLVLMRPGAVVALELDHLDAVRLHEGGDGSGCISIGKYPPALPPLGSRRVPQGYFLDLAHGARDTYQAIIDARDRLRER